MSRPRKDRIDTNAKSEGLQNPFAALEVSGLPEGTPAPPAEKETQPATTKPVKLGRVVLRKETAHRGGKAVIVVHDFANHISSEFIDELGRKLKKSLNCGGAIRDRTIEIQGDQASRIRAFLEQEGFRVAGVK